MCYPVHFHVLEMLPCFFLHLEALISFKQHVAIELRHFEVHIQILFPLVLLNFIDKSLNISELLRYIDTLGEEFDGVSLIEKARPEVVDI